MSWAPGMPIVTASDEADWRLWRRDSVLQAQRQRRSSMRRIDYYPDAAAEAVIDKLWNARAGDLSSIISRIVSEWATVSGIK